jgi:maltodextrin utilization protein YvdJ
MRITTVVVLLLFVISAIIITITVDFSNQLRYKLSDIQLQQSVITSKVTTKSIPHYCHFVVSGLQNFTSQLCILQRSITMYHFRTLP